MKLVVQAGSGVTRADLEALADVMPGTWDHQVKTLVVYASQDETLSVTYHPKLARMLLVRPCRPKSATTTYTNP